MDCQFLMGSFTYVYVSQIVFGALTTVRALLRYIISLSPQEQLQVYNELQQILTKKQLLNATLGNLV
jgi:hypothetical protein